MTDPKHAIDSLARVLKDPTLTIGPGGVRRALMTLTPAHRAQVMANIDAVNDHQDLGRHAGDPRFGDDPVKARGLHRESLNKLVGGATVDYVCEALQLRKSDAQLPLPELTRRDHISAAFDAHSQE